MKILVVSNMYPSNKYPFYGTFVKNFCDQVKALEIDYDLSVKYKSKTKLGKVLSYIHFYVKTVLLISIRKYDIIYIHYASHSSCPVLFASKFVKKINIYTNVHGSDVVPESKKQEKMQKYTKKILNISNKIIVPSIYFKDYVCQKYSLNRNIVSVYPSGGVDPLVFHQLSKKVKENVYESFNLDKQFKYIGYISRITKDKGWDGFCLALKEAINKNPNIKGIIVGSGEEQNKLNDLIYKLELSNDIVLLPSLSQIQLNEIYNVLDVLVFPSKREGESLGLIPLEAMQAGTLVIVNDFAAPASYIVDNENGFKYKTNDYKALASKIDYYFSLNSEEKTRIQQNAFKTTENYLTDKVILRLKGVLLDELD